MRMKQQNEYFDEFHDDAKMQQNLNSKIYDTKILQIIILHLGTVILIHPMNYFKTYNSRYYDSHGWMLDGS